MMLGPKAGPGGGDEDRAVIEEHSLAAPGVADGPQRQSRQIWRAADRGPRGMVSGGHVARPELPSKIDEQLPVRGQVALLRVHLAAKPLPAFKPIPQCVPARDPPPLGWTPPDDDTNAGLPGQENEHPAAIVEERRQVLDLS